MEKYKLEALPGEDFTRVAKKAKMIAIEKETVVEFDFNGITCLVDENTNRELLWRDYQNSFRMEWKTVGANCVAEYPKEVQDELNARNAEAERKAEEQRKVWAEEERLKKQALAEKITGIEMEFLNKEGWDDWKSKNTDGYGNAIFVYAEQWAKLMQVEMAAGKTLSECAEKTSFEADTVGLSGAQYGAAVATLTQTWKHGKALKEWRNEKY